MPEVDSLTLGDIEAIAARLEKACATFREARALLGGAAVGEQPPARPAAAPPAMSPEMAAQRAALLARNREALPEEIKRMERMEDA